MPKVELSEQVLGFVRAQPPEPKRRLRLALRKLSLERGDIRNLEGPLRGYSRLRVGSYRIIFSVLAQPGMPLCIRCVFAEKRDVIYSVFSDMLKRRLLEES
jgi:mRNA-degrading endonuclease RelE of RelBE toxin-antitoxin system